MSEKGIGESDKADIVRFVEHLQARNIGKLRATKYVYHLIVLARTASKSLGQLKKEDMERLVGRINSIDYSEETKHDYKVALKKYFQWLRGARARANLVTPTGTSTLT
jgi:site-specific recombinase XerD